MNKSSNHLNKPALWNKHFILICLSSFFLFMNFYALATSLPIYMVEKFNGNQQQIGLAMTIFIISSVICRPLAGNLIDRLGKKKVVLTALALFVAASTLYFGVAGLAMLFVLRLFHGAGFGSATTAISAVATELVPEERKGEGIGYYSLFMSLAMVIGPFVGLSITTGHNFTLLFAVCLACAAFAILLAALTRMPKTKAAPVQAAGQSKWHWRNFIESSALPISITGFVLAFAYSGITTFISVYAEELSLGRMASYFFVSFAALIVIPRPFIGKIFDRFGEDWLAYPGILLFALGMFVLSQAHSAAVFLFAGGVIGLGFGALLPCFQTLATLASPLHRRGLATGTYFFLFDLGYGFGSYLLGILAGHTNYRTMYLATSFYVAVTAVFYYALHHRKRAKKASPHAA